jgi:hypothetical protein
VSAIRAEIGNRHSSRKARVDRCTIASGYGRANTHHDSSGLLNQPGVKKQLTGHLLEWTLGTR